MISELQQIAKEITIKTLDKIDSGDLSQDKQGIEKTKEIATTIGEIYKILYKHVSEAKT